jgi:hypothetical protein
MPFTPEKEKEILEKIEKALNNKQKSSNNLSCSFCGHNQFSLGGGFTNDFLMDKLGGGLIIGGPVLPSIPIVCTNCGNTLFLNAKILGIDVDGEQKNETPKKSE